MRVSSTFLLSGNLMIAAAVFAVYWWRKRHLVRWAWFGWGALAWAATVAAKVAFATAVYLAAGDWLQAHPGIVRGPVGWLYGGLLTGVFEVGLAFVLVRRVERLRHADRGQAVAFGLGFGALEALLLGVLSLSGALAGVSGLLPAEQAWHYALPGSPLLWSLVPVVERISTLFIHALAGAWLLYAARTGSRKYFWMAFAFKTAVDATAMAAPLLIEVNQLGGAWLAQAVFLVYAVLGWLGLRETRALYADLPGEPELSKP